MLTELLAQLQKLIAEHASAEVLEKHLALVKDQLKLVTDENVQLKNKVAENLSEIAQLNEQVAAYAAAQKDVHYKRAVFRRNSEGRYSESPRCPNCGKVLSRSIMSRFLTCVPCSHTSEVVAGTEAACIAELIARDR